MSRLIPAFLIMVWAVAMSGPASADALAAVDTDASSVRVACLDPASGLTASMRGALIAVGDRRGEIALTAGHGLQGRTHCRLELDGRDLDIVEIRRGLGTGAAADWAVVRTARRFPARAPRYRIATVTGDTFPARLVANRSFQPDCMVRPAPPEAFRDARVMLHSCPTMPGRSGAPLVASAFGEPVLVGISLGRLVAVDDTLNNIGFARRVDADITEAVIAMSAP